MTIQEAYQLTLRTLSSDHGEREAGNIARILFEDAFGVSNFQRQDVLSQDQLQQFKTYLQRLQAGEPVQYVVGQAAFYGLMLKVSPDVLIPRPETEELVWWIKSLNLSPTTILDIGTGSGCIPIALKKIYPEAEIHALDIDANALAIAQTNSTTLNLPIVTHQLNILVAAAWSTLPSFSLIVSNPPYIPPSEKVHMPAQVIAHEPELALMVPESDPLLFYRTIGKFALEHLQPKGHLFFELNEFFAEATKSLLADMGFQACQLQRDMQGKNRMLWAQK